ncbi:DUF697 domain-containing protein [Prochlorococcus sp. MIT 1307]|uniref:DUF697 domain-containing protein n=1 Tax=Prochlorococcus sp. MIT 1307 TaxID=3096219 RepID=UPI002A760158|nr:DUF697 domain-containing protein [Prochlorococcus sp. MIT 1307]
MTSTPTTAERCRLLLNEWRKQLILTKREQTQLIGELKTLDGQIKRLNQKRLRVAAFGRVGVGKSSLLNALLEKAIFATDVAHGCTRITQSAVWGQSINTLESIELVDTPGIDEIASKARARLAARIALQVDLVLLVLDSDITRVELEALEILLSSGKPVLLTLNRCDQWNPDELHQVVQSIRRRLPANARNLEIKAVAAAPRTVKLQENGRVRSELSPPRIKPLLNHLKILLTEQGETLLALNSLRQADLFYQAIKLGRLKRGQAAAQSLIGKFAALKASGVAVNPLIMLDLAGGLACDTALVVQLSNLYGLNMRGYAARRLLKRLSLYNSFIGGVQLGVQLALGIVRQLLIFATPFTSGLSLASAAPVALAQAALAVYTTKITGRLAAEVLFMGSQELGGQPSALLNRLVKKDPQIRVWLGSLPEKNTNNTIKLQTLLP